jgi:hypothetical protein
LNFLLKKRTIIKDQNKKEEMFMLKKVFVTVLTVGVVALLGTKVEAHLIYLSGRWITHKSINCEQVIEKVRNPDVHKALSTCEITASLVQVLCTNPKGRKIVGQAATQITVVDAVELTPDQLSKDDKTQDQVNLSIIVEDPPALFNPQFCVGGTGATKGGGTASQWTVIDVEVLEFVGAGKLSECLDTECLSLSTSSTISAKCTLPAPFSVTNPPPVGIEYNCSDPVIEHVGH